MARRISLALAALLGLGLAGLIAGWLWLGGQAGQAWLLAWGQERLAAAWPQASFQAQGLEGGLLRGLRVHEPRLVHEGRELLRAEELEVSLRPWDLLRGSLGLGRLRLKRPVLSLPPLDQAPATGAKPPLAFHLARLEVEDGQIMAAPGWGAWRSLRGLDLTGSLALDRHGLAARLSLGRASLSLEGLDQPLELSGELTLRGQRLELEPLSLVLGQLNLRAQGQVDMAGDPRVKLSLQAHMPSQPLELPGLGVLNPAQEARLFLDLAGPLDGLELRGKLSGGGLAQLEGRADLPGRRLSLRLGLEQAEALAWGLAPWPVTLSGQAALELVGWPGQAGASGGLEMELGPSNLAGAPLSEGRLRAKYQGGLLRVEHIRLAAPWGSLEGEGQFGSPAAGKAGQLQARVAFRELTPPPPLAHLLPEALRATRLQGKAQAQGGLDKLAWETELGPSSLSPGLDLERLVLKGGWEKGQWRLDSLLAENGQLSLSAQGQASAQGADMEFNLRLADLSRLAPALAQAGWGLPGLPDLPGGGLAGALAAQGRLKGPWGEPAISLQASLRGLRWQDLACQEALLKAETPRLGLPPQGSLRLQARGLEAGGVLWERLSLDSGLAGGAGHAELAAQSGRLGLSLRASAGGPAWPLSARLEALSLSLGQEQPWRLQNRAGLSLGPQGVSLHNLVLARAGERISLEGGLGPRGELNLDLDLAEASLGRELARRLAAPSQIQQASLSGQLRLRGSLDAPRAAWEGRVGGLAWGGLPASRLEFSGGYDTSRLWLQGHLQSAGRRLLEMEGRLGLEFMLLPPRLRPLPGELEARLEIRDLDLAWFAPLIPDISNLQGRLNLDIQAGGSWPEPQLSGQARLQGGAFTIAPTTQAISDLELALRLEGRKVLVEKGSVQAGGPLELGGQIFLPRGDQGRWDLRLTSPGFKVGLGSLGEVQTSADLRITGGLPHPLASGILRPSLARILPRLATPLALREVVILQPGQKPPPVLRQARRAPRIVLGGPLAFLSLDAVVDAGQGLRVTIDQGWLELNGQTRVRKEPDGPLTFHQGFGMPRGLMIVHGKPFEILPSRTDFADKDLPDPNLDADVTLRAGTTQVFIHLTGSAFEPQLNFSSEPPLSQGDILSTIIFGRPVRALSAGESRELSAQALALLGQRGREEMRRLLGPNLSPDVVTVHNEYQTGSSLEAGKYLSENLYLRYRQNMGTEGGQNVGLELKLSPSISLESQVGTTHDNGVDVVFSFDFN